MTREQDERVDSLSLTSRLSLTSLRSGRASAVRLGAGAGAARMREIRSVDDRTASLRRSRTQLPACSSRYSKKGGPPLAIPAAYFSDEDLYRSKRDRPRVPREGTRNSCAPGGLAPRPPRFAKGCSGSPSQREAPFSIETRTAKKGRDSHISHPRACARRRREPTARDDVASEWRASRLRFRCPLRARTRIACAAGETPWHKHWRGQQLILTR